MIRMIIAALILLILTTSGISASSASETEYGVVLLYHRFDDPRYPSTSTSTDQLKRHIEILKAEGFKFANLSEFLKALKSGFKEKLALITIDDGYKSTLKAYKILKERRIPFVLFLYMEAVDRYPDFLTREEIEDMLKSGLVELGLHSYSHPRAEKFSSEDLNRATKRFQLLFGFTPRAYSYPYGEYTPDIVNLIKEHFSAAFTQDLGTVSNCTNPYLIPRIPLVGSWASESFLKRQINILPLCIEEKLPVNLESIKKYERCEIYTSERGWYPLRNPKDTMIKPTRKERVGVRCWKNGRIYQRIWLVIPR